MDALDGDSDLSDLSDAPSASKSPLQGSGKLNTSPAKTLSKAQPSRATKAVPASTSAASASALTSASASASPEHGRRKSLRVSVDREKEATAALSSPSKPVTYGRNKASRPSRVSVRGNATQPAEVPVPLDARDAERDGSAEQPAVERRRRSSGRMSAQDLLGDNPPGSKSDAKGKTTSTPSRSSARKSKLQVDVRKDEEKEVAQSMDSASLEDRNRLSPPLTPGPPATPGMPDQAPSRSTSANFAGPESTEHAEPVSVSQRKIKLKKGRTSTADAVDGAVKSSKPIAEVEATETSAGVLARDTQMDDAPRSARGRRINAGKNFVLDKQRASDTASARLSAVGRRDSAGGSAKKKSAARETDRESPLREADGTAEQEKRKFKIKLIRKNKVGENGAVSEGGQNTSASMSASPLSDLSDAEAKSGASEEEDEGPMVSKRRSRSSLVTGRPTQRGALVSSVDAEAPAIQSKVASKKKKKKVVDSDSDGGDYQDEEARHEGIDLEMGVEESDEEDAYEEERVPAKRKKANREEARRGPTGRGAAPSASKKKRVESLFSEEEGEEKKPSKREVEQGMKKKKSMSGLKAPLNNSAVSTPTSHGAGASRTSTTAPGVLPLPRKAGGHLTQSIASASSTHAPTSNASTSTAIKKPSLPAPRKSGGMAAFSNIFGGLPTQGGTSASGTPNKSSAASNQANKDSSALTGQRKDQAAAAAAQRRNGQNEERKAGTGTTSMSGLPKPLGFGSSATTSVSGGAALGMRSNHRMGLGGRQATSWGANGEHLTEAMISQRRTEEVHRNANPQVSAGRTSRSAMRAGNRGISRISITRYPRWASCAP
ncbi:hypothetical protein IE81DRAFT_159212 [Ceraceosorus guamensis]|uniref:Uncharacterized protein n=1 Tax=Ceraceosorus guamensis TaxID=1522189 RepID=A0A316W271_9BASI|nr:hypothetical protein IE81DRAFT_159212 [Ceraceosorus guamensis]PWN41775.1 hypothetical protein IE81DRAFT_159212 [Ceraceosorus guamensis]